MAEEQVSFTGFHQGSVMENGVLSPVKSYIALKNNTTGRVLNVEITNEELGKVIALVHGNEGDLQETEGEIAHPDLSVDPGASEEPAPEPTPESAFPDDGPEEG